MNPPKSPRSPRRNSRFIVSPAFILITFFLQGCGTTGYIRHGNQWSYAAYQTYTFNRVVTPMPAVDAASLRPLSGGDGGYAADIHHVYYCGEILKGADPASFVNIDSECWKDKSTVYCAAGIVKGADPRTFVVLKDGWFKDARRAYNETDPMQVRDPSSFESINFDWARDSKAYYADVTANTDRGEVVGADYSTFHILKGSYARDRKNIYWGNRAIENADLGSFKVGGGLNLKAKDRFRYYEFGKPVTKKEWASSDWR